MSDPSTSGGGGWQSIHYREIPGKIRWTGDGQDLRMLLERSDALGLTRPLNPRSITHHQYSPEFFKQIDDARDGLLGFIVSGNPGFQFSADPRVQRPLECFRRQIYVPGKQLDPWELHRQARQGRGYNILGMRIP